MKKLILMAMIASMASGLVRAEGAGSASVQFLSIQPDARSKAMGEVSVSMVNDGNALHLNPAGLADAESAGMSATHMVYVEETNYDYVSYVRPIGKYGVMAIGGLALYSGSIDKTSEDTLGNYVATNDSFDTMESAISLGWAKKIGSNSSIGAGIKAISQRIAEEKATGIAGDLGVKYGVSERIRTGLAVQNLGSDINGDALPTNIKAGLHTNLIDATTIIGAEINYGLDGEISAGAGAEYLLMSMFAVRAGYNNRADTDGLTGLTGGLGMTIGSITVDYSFVPFGDLGVANVLSMGVRF